LRLTSIVKIKHLGLKLLLAIAPIICIASETDASVRWSALAQPVFQTIEHNSRPLDGPIRATTQDSEGYIWLVSDNRLWRWDAYQLTQIPFQASISKTAHTPDVNTIKADPNGILWVGASDGLYRLNQQTLSLERVDVKALNNQFIDLLDFDYHNGEKRVFFGNDFSVIEWQVGSQNIHRHSLGSNVKNRVVALEINSNRDLWIGTIDGLFTKSLTEPTNTALRLSRKIPSLDFISALYSDSSQQLWIGSAKDGVYMLDQKRSLHHINLPSNDGKNPWIYDITEVSPGIIWFGTFGKGILEYNTKSQVFTSIRQQRGLKRNLLDNDIWSFFKDKRLAAVAESIYTILRNPHLNIFQAIWMVQMDCQIHRFIPYLQLKTINYG
jgi:ligand-binding sensor domain-containing protein